MLCQEAEFCHTSAETRLLRHSVMHHGGLMATRQMGRGIVLACQGGGSHTAFTAGVLEELLAHDDRDIRALSGTSGGAVCAFLAWSGLLIGGRRVEASALPDWNGIGTSFKRMASWRYSRTLL